MSPAIAGQHPQRSFRLPEEDSGELLMHLAAPGASHRAEQLDLPKKDERITLKAIMPASPVISSVLTQLCRIARAPMTGTERALRANSLLTDDMTLEQLVAAVARRDLTWSSQQAIDHGIDIETWLEAVHVAGLPESDSITVLIERLHRAEAVAEILKAGYRPGRSAVGRLIWSGRV
jgi:predicted transcriptional regulator